MDELLVYEETGLGIFECRVNLRLLYWDDEPGRRKFETKWPRFYSSDPANSRVFRQRSKGEDTLTYDSEAIVPRKRDNRPPVLLLLGNPASHSVAEGMFFASQHTGRGGLDEHKFWTALQETRFLDFGLAPLTDHSMLAERNGARRRALFALNYRSPFCIGLATFLSMPSPARSGVRGLRSLLGEKALRRLGDEERSRVANLIRKFMPKGGAVLAFQKDAYEGIPSRDAPPYSEDAAWAGRLWGTYAHDPRVQLLCAPPTRALLWRGREFNEVLMHCRVRIHETVDDARH